MQNVLFTETQRKKGSMTCVPFLGKTFVVTPAARQQKIIFFISLPLSKCVKILSIQKERGRNTQKTHAAQTSPTRAIITKAKHTTTDPVNKQQSYNKIKNNQGYKQSN